MIEVNKKKILIIVDSITGGGAARIAINKASWLKGNGFSVVFATLSDSSNDFYSMPEGINRIELDVLSDSKSNLKAILHNLKRLVEINKVIKKEKPDICIGIMDVSSVLLSILKLVRRNITIIGTVHHYPGNQIINAQWRIMRKYSYGFLDAVVALTDESKTWLETNTNAKKVVSIENCINWPLKNVEPLVSTNLNSGAQKRMIAVGSLHRKKGFDMLISAFASFSKEFDDWELVIIGDGLEKESLANQAFNLGLTDKILFPGSVGNMNEWYESSDMFILSSRSEGFPGVLLEAMASGLPVVSFDCKTGPRDIIENGISGLLVDAGDILGLSSGMKKLASEDDFRQKLGINAKFVIDSYQEERIMKKWVNLFKLLLGN
ncbi:glycosyltransferase family 4 protein [Vibrio splendidus]